MKYAKSLDANHKEIVNFLASHRVYVYDSSKVGGGFFDLITIFKDRVGFLELKIEGADAKFKRSQLEFMANCTGCVGYARTSKQALEFAVAPSHFQITQKQKDLLAGFLLRHPKQKEFSVSTVERVLQGEDVRVRERKKKTI